jgi:signal transduction histidine kinase
LEEVENRVLIKVHNFGKVIEPRDQASLFEQYNRARSTDDGTVKGWGVGLALVKGLVEAHEGSVSIESFPNKGTTFIVDLPLNRK